MCLCQTKAGKLSCILMFRYKNILLCFCKTGEVWNGVIVVNHLQNLTLKCLSTVPYFKMFQSYLKLNLLTRKLINVAHVVVEPGTKEGGWWIN